VGDTNGNGIVDPGENEIRRVITDNTGTSTDTVALNIRVFSLTYIDAANAPIGLPVTAANLANIRRVVITMTGSEPQQQSAAIGGRTQSPFATRVPDYQLMTDVRVRNLEF